MLCLPELEENVRRGVRWLDENIENWEYKINLNEFRIDQSCNCVIGQLHPERNFWDYEDEFKLSSVEIEMLGFDIPDSLFRRTDNCHTQYRYWDMLQYLWMQEIRSRKMSRLGNDVY